MNKPQTITVELDEDQIHEIMDKRFGRWLLSCGASLELTKGGQLAVSVSHEDLDFDPALIVNIESLFHRGTQFNWFDIDEGEVETILKSLKRIQIHLERYLKKVHS
jgi:hypothetical protein